MLPAAGGTFTDPTFGTTLWRITDENDGASCSIAYSYWPVFNADNTWMKVTIDGAGHLLSIDADALTLLPLGELFPLPPSNGGTPFQEDAIWSGTDPDVIFAHESSRLWQYDVSTQSYELLRDFTPEMPGQYLWQMSRSSDDDVFAFARRDNVTYAYTGFIAWKRSTNDVQMNVDTTELDEVQIDKLGGFLVVKTGNEGSGAIEVRIADMSNGTFIADLTDDAPDYAPGHSDNGRGVVVGADNWLNRITARSLAAPHSFQSLLDFGNDWTQAFHLSLLADDESWVLLSQYGPHDDGVFHNEILWVASDGSMRVRRLAHHRSVISEYDDMPRASASRDGRLIAFTSNWGGTHRDVFVLRL